MCSLTRIAACLGLAAMFFAPAIRKRAMTALRQAAMACGADLVLTWERSSSNVTSRT